MLIGYARVSTNDQETATQVAALKAAGCERIYREKASGGRWDRPELHRLLDERRKGDGVRGMETGPALPLTPGRPYHHHHGAAGRGQGGISQLDRGDRHHHQLDA